jgi:hypothetical protein
MESAHRLYVDMTESRMSAAFKLPPFGKFLDALNAAGVETRTARGFWGGVTPDGEIVVTSWTDANDGSGRFYIWRPSTNHGGLKTEWEVGNIRVGTEVRMILLRQRGAAPIGGEARSVAGAALMPGKWRIAELVTDKSWHAVVRPASGAS